MILHKGEVLFLQGHSGDLYRLKKGLLKAVRLQPDGSPLLFNLLVSGEVFPHHSLITPQPYFATVISVTTSEVERIPGETWYRELEEQPLKYREVALTLQDTLRKMQQRTELITAPTHRRIGLFQEWLSRHLPGVEVEQLLTQEEIGQFLGLSRETVNRLMRKGKG